MSKRPSLTGLKDIAASRGAEKTQESGKVVSAPSQQKNAKTPSRAGKTHVGGYFSGEVRAQLKILAAEQDKTGQQLLGEALNLLFATYGKAEIAETERD